MALYRCCGGGKSPLTKEYQCIAFALLNGGGINETANITRTDADFIVAMAFAKSTSASSPRSVTATGKAVVTIGKVGESATITNSYDIPNNTCSSSINTTITWKSADTVTQTPNSTEMVGGIMIAFCKYM